MQKHTEVRILVVYTVLHRLPGRDIYLCIQWAKILLHACNRSEVQLRSSYGVSSKSQLSALKLERRCTCALRQILRVVTGMSSSSDTSVPS